MLIFINEKGKNVLKVNNEPRTFELCNDSSWHEEKVDKLDLVEVANSLVAANGLCLANFLTCYFMA